MGNQFGGGSGKKVMTVAGALLGASIANDNERVGYKVVNKQICDTKYYIIGATRTRTRMFASGLLPVVYEYTLSLYLYVTK
jgi:uncharacterized protein YcfJ